MSDLKPCPFCGRQAEISETLLNLSARVLYTVSCINKKTCFHTDFSSFTKETAVKYWNTRPAEDALKAKNKELCSTISGMEKTIGRAEKVLGERNLLAAEVERLKAALKQIAEIANRRGHLAVATWQKDAWYELAKIAKEALANTPDINDGRMEE